MILSKTRKEAKQYALLMEQRLEQQPQFQVELLYVPAIQSLLTQDHCLTEFTAKALKSLPVPEQWYQISLISIQQIFVMSRLIRAQEFEKAQAIMANNSIESIRFGYKEIIDLFIAFFNIQLAKNQHQDTQILEQQFETKRKKVNLPLLSEAYFQNYFKV